MAREQEREKATNRAFDFMMCIPLMVIHDKFNEIMRKEFNGVCREEHFFDLCVEMLDSWHRDYVKLSDMAQIIREETGFDIVARFDNERTKKGFRKIL